mgnify:CR=1 FL=1
MKQSDGFVIMDALISIIVLSVLLASIIHWGQWVDYYCHRQSIQWQGHIKSLNEWAPVPKNKLPLNQLTLCDKPLGSGKEIVELCKKSAN